VAAALLDAALLLFFFDDEAEVYQAELVQGKLLEGVQDAVVVLGALIWIREGREKKVRERKGGERERGRRTDTLQLTGVFEL